jgi:type II secretory pathway component GspD/PulD (secretin)
MRRLGLLLVGVFVSAASAQEAKPAAPAPAEPPKLPVFEGDAVRKPDGTLVRWYRVNYVDALFLETQLTGLLPTPCAVKALTPEYVAAPRNLAPQGVPPFPTLSSAAAKPTLLRIEAPDGSWDMVRQILARLDVPQMQVKVEAKVVELLNTDELRVGVETVVDRPLGDTFFRGTTIAFPNRLDAVNEFATTFRKEGKRYVFDLIVDLAEKGAKANITSEPSIFASQGETATIRVGDSEPIVQQQLNNNVVTATTQFRETGIRLEVQPLMIGRDGIRARISAESSRVSEFRVTATSSDIQVVNPVISTRSADTILTVPNGEVVVIGGLKQSSRRDERTGIPLLMDIPLLGHLVSSTTRNDDTTELIFFLKFTVLSPSEARVIRPPGETERVGE